MDVILSLLPGANLGVQSVSPSGTSTSAQLPSPFTGLPPGSLITGFVLNRDASGNPILRTQAGDFLIQSNFFLKIGSELVVRVDAAGKNFRTSILSVDGLSPKTAETIPAHNTDADVIDRTNQGPLRAVATTSNFANNRRSEIILNGTLLQPAPNPAEVTTAQLMRGSQLLLKLLNVTLPQTGKSTVGPTLTGDFTPNILQQSNVEQPKISPQMQNISAYQRYAEHQAPLDPTKQLQRFTTSSIAAEVISDGEIAEPLLSTSLGTVRLSGGILYPQGTKLTLELVQSNTTAPAPNLTSTISSLATNWGSLQEVVDALLQTSGDEAVLMLRQLMPTSSLGSTPTWQNLAPNAQNLSAGMAFFLNALTGGNFRELIGEKAAHALEAAGKAELLTKAEGEFSVMKNLYQQPPAGQWQALFVPMLVEGEIKPLRYYAKREKKEKQQDRPAETNMRFVVELELSETGPIQLDGFVRKREANPTQFDLVIRTAHAFTAIELKEMQDMFALIGDATGYKGMMQIQQTADFPVHPLEDILRASHSAVVA